MSKLVFYGCRDCGDCSLPDIGNLCPLSSCAKGMRNGPCGGTDDGQCEVRELRLECIWARAYDRSKFYKESADMLQGPVVMYNPELKNTSAWANTFLGRDHHHYDTEPKKED
jgi:methylenetetrahydrofolate reductase (NADPH)